MRLDVEGDAAAGVGDLQLDLAQRLAGPERHRAAGRRLADGVLHQVLDDLAQPARVAADQAEVVGMLDHDGDVPGLGLRGPAFGLGPEQLADADVLQVERHLVGVDLGHVEDVVDGARELGRRLLHRRGVAAPALGEGLAGPLQELGIANDGGERGAQLIGDVAHEVAFQPLGVGERLFLGGERAFQLAGVGDVGEGDQGRAVGQGPRLVDHDPAVGGLDLAGGRRAGLRVGVGDAALQLAPEAHVVELGDAEVDHALEVAGRLDLRGRHVPEPGEGLVVQPQPPVRAEHRHRVGELVERRLLHLDQRIVLGLELQLVGDVAEQQEQAAHRVRLAHHLQRAAVGHAPHVVGAGGQLLVAVELPGLPLGVVGGLRQPPALAQAVQHLGMAGLLGEPGRLQPPQFGEGRIVEDQLLGLAEHRHGVGDVVQRLVVRLDVALQELAQLLPFADILRPDADPAAFQRLGGDVEGAALAGDRRPADGVAPLAEVGRLAGQRVGGAVEGDAPVRGLVEAGGVGGLQPGGVDPDGRAVRRGDPGRGGAGVQEGREARRGGQARVLADRRGEPEPGERAGRAALDGHQAAVALDFERAGFSPFE